MPLNVLAFDCSTSSCSAAVRADGRLRAHRAAAMARGHAEALMPMVAAVLAEAGLSWGEVALVGVTVGPGTFTGLRIGLAAARGMALAGRLPIAGVTTCDAIAHAVPARQRAGHTVLVAVDGKRTDLFVQPFSAELAPLSPPAALLPEAAARLIAGPLLLAGDGARQILAHRPDARLAEGTGAADAAVVAELAEARFVAGLGLPPVPLYLRPPLLTLPAGRTMTSRVIAASLGEVGLLAALHQACFAPGWDAAAFVQLLAMPGAAAFMAIGADGPEALIVYRMAADEAEILTLAVLPERRRRGLAGILLERAAAAAAEAGAGAMFLEVAADNTAARALYLAHGFGVVGRRRGYYDSGEDGVVMKRCLAARGRLTPCEDASDAPRRDLPRVPDPEKE
jgi:tRNA threonylcarbamoyladenosine biosynthesis protein TsaB